jgi:hypothetical protein
MTQKTIGNQNPGYVFEHWLSWFQEAIQELQNLHASGKYHGFLDDSCLVIDSETHTLTLQTRKTTKAVEEVPAEEDWNPSHSVYPPERLLQIGTTAGYSLTTIYAMLEERNPSMELILQQMNAEYSLQEFRILAKLLPTVQEHIQKGDVWMLGLVFLRTYLQYLAWPGVFSTEFYKSEHERFMDCLERMVSIFPQKRPTCAELLAEWTTRSSFYVSDSDDTLSNSDQVVPEPEPVVCETPSLTRCDVCETPCETHPSSQVVKRRLVLNGYHDPVGRNKTRRNQCSLSRNPATRSRGKRTSD